MKRKIISYFMLLCLLGVFVYSGSIQAFELDERIIRVNTGHRKSCAYDDEELNILMDEGFVRRVQAEISLDYAYQMATTGVAEFIQEFDDANINYCMPSNPCFDLILGEEITGCWKKVDVTAYESLYTSIIYTYDPETGWFE